MLLTCALKDIQYIMDVILSETMWQYGPRQIRVAMVVKVLTREELAHVAITPSAQ